MAAFLSPTSENLNRVRVPVFVPFIGESLSSAQGHAKTNPLLAVPHMQRCRNWQIDIAKC
jgi:hypothetical protein